MNTIDNVSITYVHEQGAVVMQLFSGKELVHRVNIPWPTWVQMSCKMQIDRVQSEITASGAAFPVQGEQPKAEEVNG